MRQPGVVIFVVAVFALLLATGLLDYHKSYVLGPMVAVVWLTAKGRLGPAADERRW